MKKGIFLILFLLLLTTNILADEVSFNFGGYNKSDLNNSWINKTGYTYYILKSNKDISGTSPTSSESLYFYSTNNITNMPVLTVSYTTDCWTKTGKILSIPTGCVYQLNKGSIYGI